MIKSNFIFLERIGQKLEKRLWNEGIRSWDCFLNTNKINGISKHRKFYYDRKIIEAKRELYSLNSGYFLSLLPQSEMWRLYDFFKDESIFLDIETSGLSRFEDYITVFGLYDGVSTKTMIKGINLNPDELKKELQKYKLIITFNGASFDLPFIEKKYPGLLPRIPNFDIMFLASRLGLKGGLKAIEKRLGIKRTELIENFNGGDALTLWRMYRATGDEYYLNLLVEYNEYDVINLKTLADKCVKMMQFELNSI